MQQPGDVPGGQQAQGCGAGAVGHGCLVGRVAPEPRLGAPRGWHPHVPGHHTLCCGLGHCHPRAGSRCSTCPDLHTPAQGHPAAWTEEGLPARTLLPSLCPSHPRGPQAWGHPGLLAHPGRRPPACPLTMMASACLASSSETALRKPLACGVAAPGVGMVSARSGAWGSVHSPQPGSLL